MKKVLALLLAYLMFVPALVLSASSPIVQSSGTGGTSSSVASFTSTVNVPAGLTNSILIGNCGAPSFNSNLVVSMKDGAIQMATSSNTWSGLMGVGVYVEYSPSAGSHTLTCFIKAGVANAGGDIGAIVLSGAAQSGFPDAINAVTTTGAGSETNTITTVVANTIVIDPMFDDNNWSGWSSGAGQTTIYQANISTSTDAMAATWINKATAGSISVSQTATNLCANGGGFSRCVYYEYSVAPVAVAPTLPPPFMPFITGPIPW